MYIDILVGSSTFCMYFKKNEIMEYNAYRKLCKAQTDHPRNCWEPIAYVPLPRFRNRTLIAHRSQASIVRSANHYFSLLKVKYSLSSL